MFQGLLDTQALTATGDAPSPLVHEIDHRGAHHDHDGPTCLVVVDVHLRDGRCRIVTAPIHPPWPAHVRTRHDIEGVRQGATGAPRTKVRQEARGRLSRKMLVNFGLGHGWKQSSEEWHGPHFAEPTGDPMPLIGFCFWTRITIHRQILEYALHHRNTLKGDFWTLELVSL